MSGYLDFKETGCAEVDTVVRYLNEAGNAFHHTDGWGEEVEYYGGSYSDLIQDSLSEAARTIAQLRKELSECCSDYEM